MKPLRGHWNVPWMAVDMQGEAGKATKSQSEVLEMRQNNFIWTLTCNCNFNRMRTLSESTFVGKVPGLSVSNRKPQFYLSDTKNTDTAQNLQRSL